MTIRIYRWERRSWARDATLEFERTTRFPRPSPAERLIDVEHDTHFTDSPWPDFTVDGLGLPGWLAVVSHTDGKWHVLPFGPGRQAPLVIDGYSFVEGSVEGFEDDGTTEVWYRYAGGRFRVDHRSPEPPCDPQTLEDIAGHGTRFTRSACAYGWALAFGSRRGKRVVGVFEELQNWTVDQGLTRTEFERHPDYTDLDPTLRRRLERRLSRAG